MAKESEQAVERVVVFAKVYSTKDGHPVTHEVGDKIEIIAKESYGQKMMHSLKGAERCGRVLGTLRDQLAQSEQRHQEQLAEIHAHHKVQLAEARAESDAQHKEQLTEVLA
ncbi:hypothetical protein SO802_025456 [Lithocarpus litseifolius]|uniref:Uncharacterized protein n=1 Tax=Lithocarpus litseifolius TaxID=425828 RepID=A0AAW2BX53_9ROSI